MGGKAIRKWTQADQAREIYLKWKKQRFGQFCFEGDVEISVKGGCRL